MSIDRRLEALYDDKLRRISQRVARDFQNSDLTRLGIRITREARAALAAELRRQDPPCDGTRPTLGRILSELILISVPSVLPERDKAGGSAPRSFRLGGFQAKAEL